MNITNPHLYHISKIPNACYLYGMRNIIISPGSRSAPLTIAFARYNKIKSKVVVDERSAAYIALGMAQNTGEVVGLICTSGTAVLNYMPAIAEAYYQKVPLLVLTADRPPEWIGQQDNQTIRQRNVYEGHSRGNFELPVETKHPDAQWHFDRILSEALIRTKNPVAGPVHINIPLREPLYTTSPMAEETPDCKYIEFLKPDLYLNENKWKELRKVWSTADKILIVIGMKKYSELFLSLLEKLSKFKSIVVIADVTANIYSDSIAIKYADILLSSINNEELQDLTPDILITLGGQVVSKSLKSFLRSQKPSVHWHVGKSDEIVDTFQTLTLLIPVSTIYFLKEILERKDFIDNKLIDSSYFELWHHYNKNIENKFLDFLNQTSFGDFKAIATILERLPNDSYLQLGNSMIIRYANLLGYPHGKILNGISSNRGTSGIDGTISTSVGAALTTKKITTIITGDLAFFYDRNALWNEILPDNLRIIIINNHGGGIFDLISGPDKLNYDEKNDYFLTPHTSDAKLISADYKCSYLNCNSMEELIDILDSFFNIEQKISILEVNTSPEENLSTWNFFKKYFY